ncbi:MAG TPA: tyrosine-type recombinase/integrase [Terriglobales bacterium]|nr:tyrosine-type recombinase/integrase [Terriglobales bacterium]
MKFHVAQQHGLSNAHSPFRVLDQSGEEVAWINRYLDQEQIRGVADTTLRSYANDLLHFVRWWAAAHKTSTIAKQALTESTFLDYIRFQVSQNPPPAAATVNRRVGTAERAMRREFPEAAPLFAPGFQHWYWRQSRLGYGRLRPALSQLRVKAPKRVIVPLSVDAVAHFWSSFRTSRDLSIVGLMLLHGLRSCEVLALDRDDVQLPDSQIRVLGKGKRVRVLPLARESVELLDHYMCLERPPRCGQALFVSLKGPARGRRMTPAGLRSLFRHHRRATGVAQANPHRFRHTFASDMVRAGVSLPALMQLMGHAQIQTTMVYIQITPRDVWDQYARAVAQHIRPVPPQP